MSVSTSIGIENFRGVGGYKANGKIVKQGLIFRSAKLDSITEKGRTLLDKLSIKAIIDFRDDEEVANSPTSYDRVGLSKIRLPILGGDLKQYIPQLMSGSLKASDAQALMRDVYRSFVTSCSRQYAQFLNILIDEANYPILFHCTAGKDRTGYAAALLLSLLGVQWDDVLENYLLTNDYLKGFISKIKLDAAPEVVQALLVADEQYLDTAFTVIGKDYKGVCGYADTVLSFGKEKQEKLKSILLE